MCSKTGVLGSGEFATVEKGIWNGSKGVKEVAVKTLSESATDAEKISFLQEAVIMGQFVHPNIVQLHGIVTHGGPVSIIIFIVHVRSKTAIHIAVHVQKHKRMHDTI